MEINLPIEVNLALEILHNAGFEAWCVGGAIRDHLLKITPFDYDITTNALPESIISLFEITIPTGIKHGTVTVIINNRSIEITTYRTDGVYIDHRSPKQVDFVASVFKDTKRRDFTVNSILYNNELGIYDPQNGIEDINNKTIRAIGDPMERFTEDALRILRAFRFSAQLNFDIENDTLESALALSHLLKSISAERIFIEIKKIFTSKNPERTAVLFESGALNFLGIKCLNISFISDLPNIFPLRFAYYCKLGNISPVDVLKQLKADNQTIKSTQNIFGILSTDIPTTKSEIKLVLKHFGRDAFEIYLKGEKLYSNINPELKEQYNEIIDNKEPYLISHLAINGEDLKQNGLNGQQLGERLQQILLKVIENPELNQKEILKNIK